MNKVKYTEGNTQTEFRCTSNIQSTSPAPSEVVAKEMSRLSGWCGQYSSKAYRLVSQEAKP